MFETRTFALIGALAVTAGLTATAQAQEIEVPPTAMPAPSGVDGGSKGTLGFSLPITLLSNVASGVVGAQERVPTIDIVYFLSDKAALDLIFGINFHRQEVINSSAMVEDVNLFGFAAGIGYRMYSSKNNLRSFIEPQGVLVWSDTADSASFGLNLGAALGVERNLTPWLSFSGSAGAFLSFSDEFKDIQLATQANLAANLYWK